MALPFIALSPAVYLAKHESKCREHRSVTVELLKRARMRGCRLVWPTDVVTGDEAVSAADRQKVFIRFEREARNEGADYEGETRTVALRGASQSTVDDFALASAEALPTPLVVESAVYDIGPETCRALKEVLGAAELVLVWGTAGVCEVSSFQAGQQALVDSACAKVTEDGVPSSESATRNPLHTLLLGESAVEWFCRLADSDGEMGGDLVAAGLVAYANRNSRLLSGLIGQVDLEPLKSDHLLRSPTADEWVYRKRIVVVEEEDEEEDEEE